MPAAMSDTAASQLSDGFSAKDTRARFDALLDRLRTASSAG